MTSTRDAGSVHRRTFRRPRGPAPTSGLPPRHRFAQAASSPWSTRLHAVGEPATRDHTLPQVVLPATSRRCWTKLDRHHPGSRRSSLLVCGAAAPLRAPLRRAFPAAFARSVTRIEDSVPVATLNVRTELSHAPTRRIASRRIGRRRLQCTMAADWDTSYRARSGAPGSPVISAAGRAPA